ncbi:MAG: ATP-binding protein [Acidobacteriota bacterium]
MVPRRTIILRQLQLTTLLIAVLGGVMFIFNLAYLTKSQLTGVESQLTLAREQIYRALEATITREKTYLSAASISNDMNVRAALQTAVNRVAVLRYAAIVDQSGKSLAAVDLERDRHREVGQVDMQSLLDRNPLIQMASLAWGDEIYFYSFPISLGRYDNQQALGITIRFGVPASQLRGIIADAVGINIFVVLSGLVLAIFVAFHSANLLLRPMETLINQIEKLEQGELNIQEDPQKLGSVAGSVVNKLQLLGKRLAGERTELETTRGRLTQIIGNIEERLLLLNADRRVILMSPKVDHLLGVAGIDLVGAKLEDMIGSHHPLIELLERVKESHRSIEHVMVVSENGTGPRQVLTSVQYIEDKGEPVGLLVSLRDFDSFKQFQSQLDYSDKLAALGRITSGVAHEVKNPLNAMVIHLEILRAKLSQPVADITPQLDILSSEIKRLDRVVQTFLNFTRPVKINLVPIDLNDLVHQVTRLAAAEAAAHQVELCEELSPEFLRVNGDADLLKQTLLNIILNGCQAMPSGGPLHIRTKRAGSYALITVSDRGVGIPQEVREKIFQLYYTTKQNGNGIGLAQAFRAVQLHNGRIEFDSVVDVGTTFKIYLPEV